MTSKRYEQKSPANAESGAVCEEFFKKLGKGGENPYE